ncbi:hypothetical protein CCR75_000433 [Bremia lactucae]|uniref:Phosphoribosyltransferase domain-containing protein n=1 Tax=Bremia lactucae TaxID=4779 RepID=A0A976ICS9_BRELC|nr:hypothetical protein CCR75_000433 [Bremia lactucae]
MKGNTRVDNKKYGLADNSTVWCATHPVLRHKLTKLRDERTDGRLFRHLLREVTYYLGYDASDDLETIPKDIKTPMGDHQGAELSTTVALVPILRAGLGMVEPMLDVLPNASVHHIEYCAQVCTEISNRSYQCSITISFQRSVTWMLRSFSSPSSLQATGTIIATLAVLKTWGVKKIKIVSAIASMQGLQEVCAENPGVEIFLAAIDDGLSEDGYILPGLGDAGDREFQTGAQAEKVEIAYKKQKL